MAGPITTAIEAARCHCDEDGCTSVRTPSNLPYIKGVCVTKAASPQLLSAFEHWKAADCGMVVFPPNP